MNTDLEVGYQVSRSVQDIFLSQLVGTFSPDRAGQSWRKRVLRKDGKATVWEQNKSLAMNFKYLMDRPNLLVLQRETHYGWFSSVRNLSYLCGPAQLHVRCVLSQTSGTVENLQNQGIKKLQCPNASSLFWGQGSKSGQVWREMEKQGIFMQEKTESPESPLKFHVGQRIYFDSFLKFISL